MFTRTPKIITRKFFGKLFLSCCGPIGVFMDLWGPWGTLGGSEKCLRENFSAKIIYTKIIFRKTFFRWPDRGIQGSLGALGGRQGVLREKFLREKFSPKIIYPKTIFQEFFGQLFPSRVVARQGYLGIFGGPGGRQGVLRGKNFYAKNFLQKLYTRKLLFRNFSENFFLSCCGPIGVFRDLWGPLGNARGY